MTARPQPTPIDKALLEAVYAGDLAGAKAAVDAGAVLEAAYPSGATSILVATEKGHHAVAKWLLKEGAQTEVINNQGATPLLDATRRKDGAMVDLLLNYGANPNWPPATSDLAAGRTGFHALHQTGVDGEVAIAKSLLRAGADVNGKKRNGGSPLWYAAANNSVEVATVLLAHGADPNPEHVGKTRKIGGATTVSHKNVLLNQTCSDDIPTLKLLLDGGADINAQDSHGVTLEDELKSKPYDTSDLLEVVEKHKKIPELSDEKLPELTKAELLKPNEHGYCYLDHPTTWRRFEQVDAVLREKNDALTPEDWKKPNQDGKQWLARAAECFSVGEALASFTHSGGNLGQALLDDKGEATDTLRTICEREQVEALMTPSTWRESATPVKVLRQVHSQIPADKQADIPNFHRLTAMLGNDEKVSLCR